MLAAFALCVGVFSSALIYGYGHSDDYVYLEDARAGRIVIGEDHFTRQGRPLAALAMTPALLTAKTIDNLRWIRAVSILLTLAFIFLIAREFLWSGFGPWVAAAGSLLAVLTPGWTAWVGWAVCMPYAAGAILASAGGTFLLRTEFDARRGCRYLGRFVAASFVFLALTVYQPTFGFFFLPLVVRSLGEGRCPWKRWIWGLAVPILTCAVYLVAYRSAQFVFEWQGPAISRSAFGFALEPKFAALFADVLRPLFLGWEVVFLGYLGWALALVSVLWLGLAVGLTGRWGKSGLGLLLFASSAVLIAAGPLLTPANPYVPFRTLAAPWAIVAVFCVGVFARAGWSRMILARLVLVGVVSINAVAAFGALHFGVARVHSAELSAFRTAFAPLDGADAVLFVKPDSASSEAELGRSRAHEFWVLSTIHDWVPSALVNLVAAENLGSEAAFEDGISVPVIERQLLSDTRGFEVLDMNAALRGGKSSQWVTRSSPTQRQNATIGDYEHLKNLNWCFSPMVGYFRSWKVGRRDKVPWIDHIAFGRLNFVTGSEGSSTWKDEAGKKIVFDRATYPTALRGRGKKLLPVMATSGSALTAEPMVPMP